MMLEPRLKIELVEEVLDGHAKQVEDVAVEEVVENDSRLQSMCAA